MSAESVGLNTGWSKTPKAQALLTCNISHWLCRFIVNYWFWGSFTEWELMGLIYFTICDKIANLSSSLYFCALIRLSKIHFLVFKYSFKSIIHEIFITNGRPSLILNISILLNKSYLPQFLVCSEQTEDTSHCRKTLLSSCSLNQIIIKVVYWFINDIQLTSNQSTTYSGSASATQQTNENTRYLQVIKEKITNF